MPDAKSVDGPARPVLRRRIIRKAGDTPPVPAPHHPAPLPSARLSPSAPPAPVRPPEPPPQVVVPAPAPEQHAPAPQAPHAPVPPARPERPPQRLGSRLDDLYRMPMPQLFKLAETYGMHEHTGMTRVQLIVGIVRRQIERGERSRGSGTLEVLPDGYGFLRSQAHNYLASPEDIYVSPSQIRRMSLRTGYVVEGPIRLPIENQDNFALMQIELVNGKPADEADAITGFGDLTPLHPNKRFIARDRAGRHVHADRGPGHAHRQGPARPDRRPAPHRQDDPARQDGELASSRITPRRTSSCCSWTSGPKK